ncbi:hypothetical protein PF001_g14218 [Phytophthora fragariae]|uniref:Uncharacterized protein n=2 Tax=Phytophthora fragariae TaxID=53985 RepID=A0A6A3EKJ1_9STRA|nr:hypothetical protein PF009_g16013 [Phytophthora fragariae]KAE9301952.1 hypothetical protein PF001_g14218 [Phytophthora fragariae]
MRNQRFPGGFLDLLRLGMFPKNMSYYHESDGVEFYCRKEDTGEFVCRAKRGVQESELKSDLAFACNFPDIDCSDIKTSVAPLTCSTSRDQSLLSCPL